jgi:DNA-directed RNA polymerase subunit RPC12/RpoP/acylphosphatase
VGPNAQGKTNLLEAVFYLCSLESPRVRADLPLVRMGAESAFLRGEVESAAGRVLIEVEGGDTAVERFLARLPAEAPPLASVDRVVAEGRQPVGHSGFQIVESPQGETADAQIAPDSATCADCLAELFDPHDRRHRYPFVNCTNCGPRFTIVRGVPYDRPQTTMAGFRMCARCQAEYDDPADRRFHAQPNACPVCGPSLSLRDPDGTERDLGEARDAVFQFRLCDRIREAHMFCGTISAEVQPRRDRHAGALQHVAAELFAVMREFRAVGIDEETAGRHDRDAEPQLAQRRHERQHVVTRDHGDLHAHPRGGTHDTDTWWLVSDSIRTSTARRRHRLP